MSSIAKILNDVDNIVRSNKDFAASFMKPNRPFWTTTLFLLASLQRIDSNAADFKSMAEARNYPIMAAILRMQIDTAMRVNGLSLMADHEDGIRRVMNGEKYSKIRCKAGKKLQDGYLIEMLAKQHPWVKLVYERTSGMIHLSSTHIHHALDYDGGRHAGDELTIDLIIGAINPTIPLSILEEAAEAFRHATAMSSALVRTLLDKHPAH